jgi:hypothetical protein
VADVIYIFTFVAFFALMVAFVHLCERIVGQGDAVESDGVAEAPHTTVPQEVPA